MHWIDLKHEFHNLSWITEINELFHDILIYWDAPVLLLSNLNRIRFHKQIQKNDIQNWTCPCHAPVLSHTPDAVGQRRQCPEPCVCNRQHIHSLRVIASWTVCECQGTNQSTAFYFFSSWSNCIRLFFFDVLFWIIPVAIYQNKTQIDLISCWLFSSLSQAIPSLPDCWSC